MVAALARAHMTTMRIVWKNTAGWDLPATPEDASKNLRKVADALSAALPNAEIIESRGNDGDDVEWVVRVSGLRCSCATGGRSTADLVAMFVEAFGPNRAEIAAKMGLGA